MVIVVIKPWQARLLLGLAFALFLGAGYRLTEQATIETLSRPPAQSEPLFDVPGVKDMIALTINVDWGSEQLPGMLDILDLHQAKATFFLTGTWAEKNPDLARQLAERGHEIANHGKSHAHPKALDAGLLTEHIAGNKVILQQIVGNVANLYAPPYGEWNRRIVQKAAELGSYTVMWTIDTIDWQDPSPATIIERVLSKARGGAIVLMHPKPNTAAALSAILTGLERKGLRAVTLSEMLAAAGTANTTVVN